MPSPPSHGPTPEADPTRDPAEELGLDLDEVGVAFGLDEVTGGLFDRSSPEVSGGEPTHASGQPVDAPPRRTAIFAWIAADVPGERRLDADPTAPAPGADALSADHPAPGAIGALRSLLLDEPLDPIPALDVPTPMGARRRDAATRAGDDELTAPIPPVLPAGPAADEARAGDRTAPQGWAEEPSGTVPRVEFVNPDEGPRAAEPEAAPHPPATTRAQPSPVAPGATFLPGLSALVGWVLLCLVAAAAAIRG